MLGACYTTLAYIKWLPCFVKQLFSMVETEACCLQLSEHILYWVGANSGERNHNIPSILFSYSIFSFNKITLLVTLIHLFFCLGLPYDLDWFLATMRWNESMCAFNISFFLLWIHIEQNISVTYCTHTLNRHSSTTVLCIPYIKEYNSSIFSIQQK